MRALCAIVLAVFVLAGCKGGLEKQVVGSWKGDGAKSEFGGPSGQLPPDKKKEAEAMLAAITLDIKDDKTFELKIFLPLKGTWAITDNKLVLTPNKEDGSTSSFGGKPTMDFDVDPSGTSMTFTSTDPKQPGKLVLVKS